MKEREIFIEALQKSMGAERSAFLAASCRDDQVLRHAVERLLIEHQKEDDFLLDSPPPGLGSRSDEPAIAEQPGSLIDRYKLLELIGEGGFGDVYMAEQTEPVCRQVALKIIRLGMDTKQVIARFEVERQALAMMDHPNIAKVLDAGATDTGRPFFVMELSQGPSLTEYCDRNNLTTNDRLELFIDICHAIEHAHQRGVIHRDIKPSNLIVTAVDGQAVPKVIDFGIAKATGKRPTEGPRLTSDGQFLGTPQYMSPEQAGMSDLYIDIRTDVYSLGVVLYELLVGQTPFDAEQLQAPYDEICHVIREVDPPTPSNRLSTLGAATTKVAKRRQVQPTVLRRLLRGDLDAIVMKAMEKDREDRYGTAKQLADDLRRFLNNEPIHARPPGFSQRLTKWSRRHKPLVWSAAAACAVVLVVIGVGGVVTGGIVAKRQRQIADQQHVIAAKNREIANEEHQGRITAEKLLSASHCDYGQALAEQGEVGRGMLWLARSLAVAPEDQTELRSAIHANLAVWRSQLNGLRMQVKYPGSARAVAFSPDGARILAGGEDETVRLWEAATGKPIGNPLEHDSAVKALAVSPDGSQIAVVCADRTLWLWDAATLKTAGQPLECGDGIEKVAYSRDGTRIVTSGRQAIQTWDAVKLTPVGEPLQLGRPQVIAATTAGLRAVIKIQGEGHRLWDIDRREPVGPVCERVWRPGAISPDGSKFMARRFGAKLLFWDGTTGKQEPLEIRHGGTIYAVAFSPDSSRVAAGGNTRAAMVWDVATGRPIGAPLRQHSSVVALAFSGDGSRILVGGGDGTIRLWDVAQDDVSGRIIENEDSLAAAAFSCDGLRILTYRDGRFQLKDADGNPVGKSLQHQRQTGRMVFSPDGSLVLTVVKNSWSGQIHQVATGEPVEHQIPGPTYGVAFSPDGSRVLFGSQFHGADLWDIRAGKLIGNLPCGDQPVSSVAFSPDGTRILTGSYDGITRFWDASTLEPIGDPTVHHSMVKSLAYCPTGNRIAVGFADGTARLFDPESRQAIGVPLQHREIVNSVVFSPDGRRLLTCSLDQTARLWDTATLKPLGPPLRHGHFWPKGCFSHDGQQLLVTGAEGSRLWALPEPLGGTVEQMVLWTQVVTGLELDATGGIVVLDSPAWRERYELLEAMGGSPQARTR